MPYGIVATVINDGVLRTGARVRLNYIYGGRTARVWGLSKSGRPVGWKFIPLKRLRNFRAAWLPDHPDLCMAWEERLDAQDAADELNLLWSGIRAFDHKGRLVKDGVPESAVDRVYVALMKETHVPQGRAG